MTGPMAETPPTCEALLAGMVSIDTVNPDFGGSADGQARLANYLETVAQAWGMHTARREVSRGAYNLTITLPPIPGAPWLLFESHLDTVSTDGMTVPPFTLSVAGTRLHGRGSCDTKGSGAAMLWAVKSYASLPGRRLNAGVVFVVDEESSMTGAQAFAAMDLKAFEPLIGVVVGEPTQLRPVVAHNGALRWRTITRGTAAHSADPSKGRSAIHTMMAVITALETKMIPLAIREFPLTGRAAASINVIRGGSAVNVVPDYCEILCDRRLVPGETTAQVLAERDRALEGLEVENDQEFLAPPLPPENSSRLHAWMLPAFEKLGLDAKPVGARYATDASHYAAAGAQVVVLGPGDIAQAHTRDEYLDRRELECATSLYLEFLRTPPPPSGGLGKGS